VRWERRVGRLAGPLLLGALAGIVLGFLPGLSRQAGLAQEPPPAAAPPAPASPTGSPAGPADTPPAAPDPLAAGKALVRRYIQDVLAGGRLDLVEDFVAADYADHTPGADAEHAGPELVRRTQERLRAQFRDVRYTIDQLVAEGDLVVARYVVEAVHQPPEAGAATPRAISITGMTIFRVEGGKIRESWTINDQLEMFRQLGFTLKAPAPQPAAAPAPHPSGR
jgi:predicted ester cyclase